MLLGTLGASLLGNLLTGKIINRVGKGKGINRASERIIRADYGYPSSLLCIIIKWIFNTVLSFNKLLNTKILSK